MSDMASRNTIRGQSSDFVRMMVEKAKQKEEPANPEAPQVDPKKIEELVKQFKDNAKPQPKPVELRRKKV